MHYWGDSWFQEHGENLYAAISYIEKNLRKYHIGVYGKEKYGCYRDDYLSFWNGGLYQIIWGYRMYQGTFIQYPFKWMTNLANKIHKFIACWLDSGCIKMKEGESIQELSQRQDKYWWKGLKYYTGKLGLTKLINDHQAKMYNKVFQKACKKWPDVIDELICDTEGYQMIKQCKYGDIDGKTIHDKYWITIK